MTTMARILNLLYKTMFIFLLTATATVLSSAPRPVMTVDVLPHNTEYTQSFRDERNIDKQNLDDDSKFLSVFKRKDQNRIKHPFIITKEDIDSQDNIVEDNIIVESNVLRLIRPSRKNVNEILRIKRDAPAHNRVKRGWNLQNVIVPNTYPYVAVPKASNRWHVRRSKDWYDEPVKYSRSRYQDYKGWGSPMQELHQWPVKIYG